MSYYANYFTEKEKKSSWKKVLSYASVSVEKIQASLPSQFKMQFPFALALLSYSHTFILEQKVDTISNFLIFETCRSFAGAITLLAFLNGLAFPLSTGVSL